MVHDRDPDETRGSGVGANDRSDWDSRHKRPNVTSGHDPDCPTHHDVDCKGGWGTEKVLRDRRRRTRKLDSGSGQTRGGWRRGHRQQPLIEAVNSGPSSN